MNSIETKIDHIIDECLTWRPYLPSYKWTGLPYSINAEYWGKHVPWCSLDGLTERDVWFRIDRAIKEASSIDCLTSPIQYIRECKRYYDESRLYSRTKN